MASSPPHVPSHSKAVDQSAQVDGEAALPPEQSALSPPTATESAQPGAQDHAAAASPSATSPVDAVEQAAADNPPIVGEFDRDSVYASSLSDTESLPSSYKEYQHQYGRRYHAPAIIADNYWGPNDQTQQNAEDRYHLMHVVILGTLHNSPLTDPQKVLDVGCGTGAWAMDFADEYPSAEVIGIDISPIQPDFVPPNCRFEMDDMNLEWTFCENTFDFVHIRNMLGTCKDWGALQKKVFRILKPGGWVEHIELSPEIRSEDGTIPSNSPLLEWPDLWKEVGEKTGYPFNTCDLARPAITDAGFDNVEERIIRVPIGTWPLDEKLKGWGRLFQKFVLQGLEGFSLRSVRDVLEWSDEQAQVFLALMRRDLKDQSIHAYTNLHIVYGQKPG